MRNKWREFQKYWSCLRENLKTSILVFSHWFYAGPAPSQAPAGLRRSKNTFYFTPFTQFQTPMKSNWRKRRKMLEKEGIAHADFYLHKNRETMRSTWIFFFLKMKQILLFANVKKIMDKNGNWLCNFQITREKDEINVIHSTNPGSRRNGVK